MADAGNHRVLVFRAADGAFLGKLGGGAAGSGDGEMSYPNGVALSPSGELLVAEGGNHRVQVFRGSEAVAVAI